MNARRIRPSQPSRCEMISLECAGLSYVATFSRFEDGSIGEIFLSNHKSGSAADVNARDAAIAASFALQFGADINTIRKALCRDFHGRPSGRPGVALDAIAADKGDGGADDERSEQKSRRREICASRTSLSSARGLLAWIWSRQAKWRSKKPSWA